MKRSLELFRKLAVNWLYAQYRGTRRVTPDLYGDFLVRFEEAVGRYTQAVRMGGVGDQ